MNHQEQECQTQAVVSCARRSKRVWDRAASRVVTLVLPSAPFRRAPIAYWRTPTATPGRCAFAA
jgi:hypothetical protein